MSRDHFSGLEVIDYDEHQNDACSFVDYSQRAAMLGVDHVDVAFSVLWKSEAAQDLFRSKQDHL